MKAFHRWAPVMAFAVLVGCEEGSTLVEAEPSARAGLAGGVLAKVTGSGHVIRDLGQGPELTTFSYNAEQQAEGGKGQWEYNFRAADFSMHGSVSCVSTMGNRGWIGGVIGKVNSDDPVDQELVGTEIWWLVEDNGQGASDPPDRTTSLLFALPGLPITAESWCRDQQVRGVLREIVAGNIYVH